MEHTFLKRFLADHFRYLQNENVKLMPDIVGNATYKEQFESVEQCFKVIGFTLEVMLSHGGDDVEVLCLFSLCVCVFVCGYD